MISRLVRHVAGAACIAVFWVSQSFAAQTLATQVNGSVTFSASTGAVTRITVTGDRIRRLINDDTAFEMTNDETTGDVFLRFNGAGTASREQGFIITEKGLTIGYTLRPTNRPVDPVVITVAGAPASAGSTAADEDDGDFSAGVGFSDNVALSMREIARKVYAENLVGQRPSGGNNRVFKRVQGSGWRATIRVATGGSAGRLVREQEFYARNVSGVVVIQPQLGANQRTFVIVLEVF